MKKTFEVQWEGRNELSASELQKALNEFASDNDTFTVKRLGEVIMDESKEFLALDKPAQDKFLESKQEDILGMNFNFNKAKDKTDDVITSIMGKKTGTDMLDNLRDVL